MQGTNGMLNVYGAGYLGVVDKIYAQDGKKFTAMAYHTCGPWFGGLMRGYNVWMEVIKNQGFLVTIKVVKALFKGWESNW